MLGTLNLVSTPIGDYSDMSLRALRTLEESDIIYCEEFKEGARLLRFFEIKKDLEELNEHNEAEASDDIFNELLIGKNISIISDCGTPLFSDPGKLILNKCIEAGIKTEFLSGANSLLSSIVLSGFDISRFYYYGFLSPKAEIRKKEMKEFCLSDRVSVILDAPYRLKAVLNDIRDIFGERKVFVAFNITQVSEKKFRGSAAEILNEIGEENLKGEFVIVIDKHYEKTIKFSDNYDNNNSL
ncbi:MAG TPA: 16S rRNA (cytidine(1402)-2'-O)-methyltransferase [Ignavibacteria bacterium]|nr:16S rRNA (cytidine(1402)-2'-O)-methyltransferase [Bacteroidota bacterium]HRI84930.1 16S rRNA (cytidine(1402)-2'-O)-methyltransferase [Ignavibacteria bacterium]HRK00125.1 16S rRNA (cytidine(1402)-2'-O)-methyltransferase [Ignavibacteria bacterium]